MSDTDITELDELGAEKVSGVGNPANSTPWLLLKAQEDVVMTPVRPGEDSEEAEDIEDKMTKGEAEEIEEELTKARWAGFCGIADCNACEERFGPMYPQLLNKAKLTGAERSNLPKSQFAYVDSSGVGHLPIHDASHTRNALARFNQTHFESAEVKKKASRKIKAKAKAFGIEVDKGSPGVPDFSTATPKENSHTRSASQSGLAGAMTTGRRLDHVDPSFAGAGESTFEIPVETVIQTNPAAPAPLDRPGALGAMPRSDSASGKVQPLVFGTDVEPNVAPATGGATTVDNTDPGYSDHVDPLTAGPTDIPRSKFKPGGKSPKKLDSKTPWKFEVDSQPRFSKDSWEVEVVQKGNWVSLDKEGNTSSPSAEESSTPGNAAWQSYDAASCDSVARGLAEAKRALESIKRREETEAATDPSEWNDAYRLSCAAEDVWSALSLVASLAYMEAADGNAQKAGRKLSRHSEGYIRTARDHLTELLGEGKPADVKNGAKTSEEESIMATVTKEELDAHIADAAAKATTKQMKKFAKAQAKRDKKMAKAFALAIKVSNNNGDLTEGDIRGRTGAKYDANDLNFLNKTPRKEYVNKGKNKGKSLKSVEAALETIQTTVAKMASQPRQGGPVLDGQSRGAYPASEGRGMETVTKSDLDGTIERLEKEMSTATDGMAIDQISRELTLARLRKGHEDGLI